MTFEVNIKVKGKTIPSYFHEGDTWVEGRVGSEYTLEFKNKTNKNVLIVPSVDGLSILDGEPATENSKGYIVYAHSTVEIPGWTLDNDNVAKFVFSDVDNSYSTYQSGNSDNNGVIGFKVFYEKENPYKYYTGIANTWWNREDAYKFPTDGNPWDMRPEIICGSGVSDQSSIMRSSSIMSATGGNASINNVQTSGYCDVDHSVGTGFGDQTEYKVTEVEFEKGLLADTIVVYYDSLKNLKARGIKIEPQKKKPQPFKTIGCVPPKGWQK